MAAVRFPYDIGYLKMQVFPKIKSVKVRDLQMGSVVIFSNRSWKVLGVAVEPPHPSLPPSILTLPSNPPRPEIPGILLGKSIGGHEVLVFDETRITTLRPYSDLTVADTAPAGSLLVVGGRFALVGYVDDRDTGLFFLDDGRQGEFASISTFYTEWSIEARTGDDWREIAHISVTRPAP